MSIIHCIKWFLRIEKFIYLLIIAAMPLLSSCQNTQSTANEYELYINRAAEVWRFQGSYLVAKGDSILAQGSCGYANLASQRTNTPETKFLIGSMTKPFTAIATLQLVERGLIDLDQNISAYISIYPSDGERVITVHDLLCHRSGIPDVINNRKFASRMSDQIDPQEIVNYFRDEPLDFEPGSQYTYSSSNFVLLGLITEAVTGLSWEEYIENYICKPVGIENTGIFYDYTTRSDFAKGYTYDQSGSLIDVPPIHPSFGYAAGALASTVLDLYSLNLALYDTTLLTSRSIDMMLRSHSPKYGYGWLVDDFGNHKLTAHAGGAPGYVSIMQRWLDDSVCVVVLCNNVRVSVHTIANGLAAIALHEPYSIPQIKRPMPMHQDDLIKYEGNYSYNSGELRHIQLREGKLTIQRSSSPPLLILPEAWDKFYFAHDQMTTLMFLRDSNKEVVGHVMIQAFDHDTAWRVE